jgi:hypothetical protein
MLDTLVGAGFVEITGYDDNGTPQVVALGRYCWERLSGFPGPELNWNESWHSSEYKSPEELEHLNQEPTSNA